MSYVTACFIFCSCLLSFILYWNYNIWILILLLIRSLDRILKICYYYQYYTSPILSVSLSCFVIIVYLDLVKILLMFSVFWVNFYDVSCLCFPFLFAVATPHKGLWREIIWRFNSLTHQSSQWTYDPKIWADSTFVQILITLQVPNPIFFIYIKKINQITKNNHFSV